VESQQALHTIMGKILSSNRDVSHWLASFEARLSLLAQANNVENEVLSLQSAIQATTVFINTMESMFCETEPIEVGSHPTLVKHEVSARSQMLSARQQLDSVCVELQAMLGDLDFGHQVSVEDVLKTVRLVQEVDLFLRQKSRSPSP
jgi:predicted component of type VI protein secretion system